MVDAGEWGQGQDKALLQALVAERNKKEWDVEWGELVPGRSHETCKRRWNLMKKWIPDALERTFAEQVQYLVTKHLT